MVHKKEEGGEADGIEVVNLRKMGKTQRQLVVDRALATSEQSNEEFERKFQQRVQRYVLHLLDHSSMRAQQCMQNHREVSDLTNDQ